MKESSGLRAALRASAFRHAAVYVAVFVAAALALSALVLWRASEMLSADALGAVEAEAAALQDLARAAGGEAIRAAIDERAPASAGGLYLLVDGTGAKLAGNLSRVPPELAASGGTGAFRFAGPGRERLAVGHAAELPGIGLLVVGRELEPQRQFLERVRGWFLGSFALLALLGLGGGIVLSRGIARRIDGIRLASERVMAGALSERLPVSARDDEIDALARQVNAMLARIEELLASLKEVSDNIAHDLKTPLTRLRNRADAALRDRGQSQAWREGLERTIEEADEIIKTFNALLLISRIEAGALEESATTFDFGPLVRDVAELYEPVAEQAGLVFAKAWEDDAIIVANRHLVGQAVANLIDNAIKYGVPSALPEPVVWVRAWTEGGWARLAVADQGPGIAAADRERALKRFVRLDESRTKPGTGLGLSLVAAVARMHGGSLDLADNGPGLKAVLSLPLKSGSTGGDGGRGG